MGNLRFKQTGEYIEAAKIYQNDYRHSPFQKGGNNL